MPEVAPSADIVTLTTATGDRVTWCYVTDPEGNIVELQSWAAAGSIDRVLSV